MSHMTEVFGKDGFAAVDKELSELVMHIVMSPLNPNKMTRTEKMSSLQYLMFLSKKQCRRIKWQGCVDGQKQCLHTHCNDASASTISTAALKLSCIIDAKERRKVATLDVPNTFMQADMDKLVNMKIEGSMNKMLVKMRPELYQKHLCTKKGKLVLYV
eukprot:1643793-Ditylum_brightwellii.AAC.2